MSKGENNKFGLGRRISEDKGGVVLLQWKSGSLFLIKLLTFNIKWCNPGVRWKLFILY